MKMLKLNENHSEKSYMSLRRFIGVLGILMPIILIFGTMFIHANRIECKSNWQSLQPSLSHYYYSIMHVVFVGLLCILCGFLVCYRGKFVEEKIISTIAGICAFGVAVFPTLPNGFNKPECYSFLLTQYKLPHCIEIIHFAFAGILFCCFAVFCLRLFPFSDKDNYGSVSKKRKTAFYICGVLIVISIVVMLLINKVFELKNPNSFFITNNILIFEIISLWAFGFSWLLSGTKVGIK